MKRTEWKWIARDLHRALNDLLPLFMICDQMRGDSVEIIENNYNCVCNSFKAMAACPNIWPVTMSFVNRINQIRRENESKEL